jgi:hypothetical protein
MDIGKLIAWTITVGLILASLGTLAEVTAALKMEAVKAHQMGIISLGGFNRRLQRGH